MASSSVELGDCSSGLGLGLELELGLGLGLGLGAGAGAGGAAVRGSYPAWSLNIPPPPTPLSKTFYIAETQTPCHQP
jgi:hypothetical protein